jgi:hypothetical protein
MLPRREDEWNSFDGVKINYNVVLCVYSVNTSTVRRLFEVAREEKCTAVIHHSTHARTAQLVAPYPRPSTTRDCAYVLLLALACTPYPTYHSMKSREEKSAAGCSNFNNNKNLSKNRSREATADVMPRQRGAGCCLYGTTKPGVGWL